MTLQTALLVLHHPIMKGTLVGILSAASVDYAAFRSWKSFHDVHDYAWGLAVFRWCQGAVVGALSSAGLGALLGA